MGSVRLKKASPVTLAVGAALCIFILYFLIGSSAPDFSASRKATAASHPLSPPTSPFRKTTSGGKLKAPPVAHYNLNDVSTTSQPLENRENILLLTPMARFYPAYWDNLLRLDYPHELITLGFILPRTKEGNDATKELQKKITKTQKYGPEKDRFKSIIILREDMDSPLSSQDEGERHKMENQRIRRAAMAKARNSLVFTTLGPSTSWILWLDADVIETPPTIIQDLARHDQAIIAPNCFQRYWNAEKKEMDERPYDFNNWQDSPTALDLAKSMGPDDILLEGYSEMATFRTLMAYLATDDGLLHEEIPLDGVGGAALLVKADVHRDGAMFPPFAFYHLIETEGFAKMAKRLGWQPFGLPNYKVASPYHLWILAAVLIIPRSITTTSRILRLPSINCFSARRWETSRFPINGYSRLGILSRSRTIATTPLAGFGTRRSTMDLKSPALGGLHRPCLGPHSRRLHTLLSSARVGQTAQRALL
jgi:mannan polymerase complexes MNN9 subunit